MERDRKHSNIVNMSFRMNMSYKFLKDRSNVNDEWYQLNQGNMVQQEFDCSRKPGTIQICTQSILTK